MIMMDVKSIWKFNTYIEKYSLGIYNEKNLNDILISHGYSSLTKISDVKLKDIDRKYGSRVKISFMFDKWNFLDYKDSPIDKGKDIFLELFKRRISI